MGLISRWDRIDDTEWSGFYEKLGCEGVTDAIHADPQRTWSSIVTCGRKVKQPAELEEETPCV